MKTFKKILKETVDKIRSDDEQNFVDKHIVDKIDHPSAEEDQFVAKTKKKKRLADREEGNDEAVYEDLDHELTEKEMTDAQMKKREEIVKSMKKKMGDFKDNYGDDAENVMYATATKMAMKEQVQFLESIQKGRMKLKDGSNVTLSKEDAEAVNNLFDELNSSNRKKMQDRMMKDEDGFDEIVKFAREAM